MATLRKQKTGTGKKRKHKKVCFIRSHSFESFSKSRATEARSLLHNPIVKMNDSSETIQEIAYKLMLEQNKNEKILNGPTERTIFVLGSKGVVS